MQRFFQTVTWGQFLFIFKGFRPLNQFSFSFGGSEMNRRIVCRAMRKMVM
jgi:hypothetical protein